MVNGETLYPITLNLFRKDMKTIEERAKEYESNIGSQDYVSIEIEEAFKAGANWMLEKAADWIGDNVVVDKFGRPINIENFRKAMEE